MRILYIKTLFNDNLTFLFHYTIKVLARIYYINTVTITITKMQFLIVINNYIEYNFYLI